TQSIAPGMQIPISLSIRSVLGASISVTNARTAPRNGLLPVRIRSILRSLESARFVPQYKAAVLPGTGFCAGISRAAGLATSGPWRQYDQKYAGHGRGEKCCSSDA